MQWIIAGFIAILAGLFVTTRKADAAETVNAVTPADLDTLFAKWGARYNVDPDLIKAVSMVESSLDRNAVRWNPPNDVSVGLMQILAVPPHGTQPGTDYTAQNKFNIDPWPVTYSALFDADLNINLGTQILSWNLRTFGFPRGIAVYNRWDARTDDLEGPFKNQEYVNRVLRNLSTIKGA